MFDKEALLAAVTTSAGSTEYAVLPEGEEFTGRIKTVEIDSGTKDGKTWAKLNLALETSGARVKEVTGRDSTSVRYGMFLDVTEAGGLDWSKGMNVKLSKLREVLGQNKAGQQWSLADLRNQTVVFTVKHRMVDGELFQDVAKVMALA